jgi:hypothetical protein
MMLPQSAPGVLRDKFGGMFTMRSVPGALRDEFGGMSTVRDEIRPSYCCCDNSLCTEGCEILDDCGDKYGCNDEHCE